MDEVQQVVQVDFPIGFGLRAQRQVFSSLLAGDAGIDAPLIQFARSILKLFFGGCQLLAELIFKWFSGSLSIGFRLSPPFVDGGGLSGVA